MALKQFKVEGSRKIPDHFDFLGSVSAKARLDSFDDPLKFVQQFQFIFWRLG